MAAGRRDTRSSHTSTPQHYHLEKKIEKPCGEGWDEVLRE